MSQACSISDCDSRSRYRGWCNKHYLRWRRHGDPTRTDLEWSPLARLERDTTRTPDGCWIYSGRDATPTGYQRWYVGGKRHLVHRWTYEHFVAPIPAGMQIDHLCRVTSCCNPEHLRVVTPRQNVLASPTAPSAINARKTHCIRGHLFDAANTYVNPANGARKCRPCAALRANRRNAQRRSALT